MIHLVYFTTQTDDDLFDHPFLAHQLKDFGSIQKHITVSKANEGGFRTLRVAVDNGGSFTPTIIKRAMSYVTDPLFVRTEFIRNYHLQYKENEKLWGDRNTNDCDGAFNDYTYTQNTNCHHSNQLAPDMRVTFEVDDDDIRAIEWAKYMGNPWLAYTIIHNYDVIVPSLWNESVRSYKTRNPSATHLRSLLDDVILRLYVPYQDWLASFNKAVLTTWSPCVVARVAVLLSRNYETYKVHHNYQWRGSTLPDHFEVPLQVRDFIHSIRNKCLMHKDAELEPYNIVHKSQNTQNKKNLHSPLQEWVTSTHTCIYTCDDLGTAFREAVFYDGANMEYENVKATQTDVCIITKKPLKPNTAVWRCSKCGCVASLTQKGLMGRLRKFQNRARRCPCPTNCGNYVYKEDDVLKHTHTVNVIEVNGQTRCPILLAFETQNDGKYKHIGKDELAMDSDRHMNYAYYNYGDWTPDCC